MKDSDSPQTFAEGRFLRLVRRRHWEWAERTSARGAAIIVALTTEHRVLFVEQHRIPIDATTIELPAGLVGDTAGQEREDPAEAARRELLEETGHEAPTLEFLAECLTSPGLTDESVRFYLARREKSRGWRRGRARRDHGPCRAARRLRRVAPRSGCPRQARVGHGACRAAAHERGARRRSLERSPHRRQFATLSSALSRLK